MFLHVAYYLIIDLFLIPFVLTGDGVANQGQIFQVQTSSNGSFSIIIDGHSWLYSGDTYFQADGRHHSTSDGTLKMIGPPSKDSGMDTLGKWDRIKYTYKINQAQVETYIRAYKNLPVAVFSQVFRDPLEKTSLGNKDAVISAFPSFKVGTGKIDLGALHFGGLFIGWVNLAITRWTSSMKHLADGMDSGPLVLFDKEGNVLIISPMNQFMASSFRHDPKTNTVSWGIMGDVQNITEGFLYETVIYYNSEGINKAMEGWGRLLRTWYGRDTASRDHDLTNNYLGYYTDNGAFYYHNTEIGENYEETILWIHHYAKQYDIPYRYLQYDDWWYYITRIGYGATISWDALPEVFPHGLRFMYNMTHLPVVAHNRYWSSKTTYAKQNGGKYNFLMDGEHSIPDDQEFWDSLFAQAVPWGMVVYEQDWLNYQVDKIRQLRSDVSMGRKWLLQMGEAADRYGVKLQYCMALPRHLLATLEIPAVSQVRASIDYHLDESQWQIGITSMFAHALGVAPFKDNFWTASKQPGNPYNKTEVNPLLQATVAILSTGPVGVGDRLGLSNITLIEKLTTSDGLLLKPSRPAMAVDEQILQAAFGGQIGPVGEVWTTYSLISRELFGIIFCPGLQGRYSIGPKQAGFGEKFPASVIYSYKLLMNPPSISKLSNFSDTTPLQLTKCTHQDFCLYYTSPVYRLRSSTAIILGEMSKLVPVSPNRVTSIVSSSTDVLVTLKGSPGEVVEFYVYFKSRIHMLNCKISDRGTAIVTVTTLSCH